MCNTEHTGANFHLQQKALQRSGEHDLGAKAGCLHEARPAPRLGLPC